MHTRFAPWAAAAATLALLPAWTPTAARAGSLSVLMSGLNNPYGLTFGPDGGLYVAEAGTGGFAGTGPSLVDGTGATLYFGDTGSVREYRNGVQSTFLAGLPSLGPAGGGETTGLADLTFGANGDLYGLFGLGADPAQRATLVGQLPAGSNAAELGQLVDLTTGAAVSDIAGYETPANYKANNPDYSPQNPGDNAIEANPYALTALAGGGFAVTDGGGNVVLKAPAGGGAPALMAALPGLPNPLFNPASPTTSVGGPTYQSVPTAITAGPGGGLLVAEFGGFPGPAGGSTILSLDPATGQTSVFAAGFTSITGLAFGPGGALYVLDGSTSTYYGPPSPAQLFQYDPATGTRTLLASLAAGSNYTGLTAGADGSLYITSQGSDAPGSGQVLRYSPSAVPEAPGGALLLLGLLPLALRAARRRKA